MRTTFLAIVFALAAFCARADQIDNVVTGLPDFWNDNETGVIIMPQTAPIEDVLRRVFGKWRFPTNHPPTGYVQNTNFTVLKTRQVAIPVGRYPGAHVYSYTAVLVQSNCGEKVVLLRCFDVYTSRAWLGAFFDVKLTWKKIENIDNSGVSFSVPSSFKKTAAHGMDSFVQQYVADGIELDFFFDDYSNNFLDWSKETKFENLKIDDKAARIGTEAVKSPGRFRFYTQVHIKFDDSLGVVMFAACKSEKEVSLARKIFETVVFKPK